MKKLLVLMMVVLFSFSLAFAEDLNITQVGKFGGSAGSAIGVSVEGNYAYVADDDNGLVIVDITDKNAPTLKGSYDTAGYAFDVSVEGDYAYVADGANGLLILDKHNLPTSSSSIVPVIMYLLN